MTEFDFVLEQFVQIQHSAHQLTMSAMRFSLRCWTL